MEARFADLKKVPKEPAARLLAMANARLRTPLKARPAAPVSEVLAELEAAEAWIDMLRLLSVALPARERTWWACLAARDLLPPDVQRLPPPLAAAEAWVFKPGDETRAAARAALESAEADDDTTLCATTVVFCDGTLGPGDLAQHAAPPGAAQAAAFGMNLMSLGKAGTDLGAEANRLIDRALDIARGGNGRTGKKPEDQA